jgi:hypothetical protein
VTAVADSPTDAVFPVIPEPVNANVKLLFAAEAGAVLKKLKPSATTTPSAIRLKVDLLVISFLSEVVTETFSITAGEENFAS